MLAAEECGSHKRIGLRSLSRNSHRNPHLLEIKSGDHYHDYAVPFLSTVRHAAQSSDRGSTTDACSNEPAPGP